MMPKLGYHATYWRNFSKIVNAGLIPGGKTTSKGNSGRPFNMMALEPQWERKRNQGVRPGAQVEFVIDLQLAACDGCRFFETKAGALQTPDWISNRVFMYAYDRTTQEMIWANRAYKSARKRLAQACKDKSIATPIFGGRGHHELVEANGYCCNYIVAGLGALTFDT